MIRTSIVSLRSIFLGVFVAALAFGQPVAALAAGPQGGIPIRPVQAGYCSAIVPADWQPTATDPKGTMLELSNGTFSAFYFIMGVDAMSQQGIPGMGHPAMLVQSTVAGGFRGDPFQRISQPMAFGDLYVQEFDSAQFHAVALFRAYPMPMGGYVVLMRIASGPRELWSRYGAVAVNVATSTRCRAQLTMAPGPEGGSRTARSAESTYNAQLGTEYAHDPATGEAYLMNHASDWWEGGPQGAGYYKPRAGGGYVKLEAGLGQ